MRQQRQHHLCYSPFPLVKRHLYSTDGVAAAHFSAATRGNSGNTICAIPPPSGEPRLEAAFALVERHCHWLNQSV